jgi:two-component system, chemotaxis family, CheB/CheR fusion protein
LHDVETVLEKLTHKEAEISNAAGRWYLRRLIPYRTRDNRIVGTVLTFTDITERKHTADASMRRESTPKPSSRRSGSLC